MKKIYLFVGDGCPHCLAAENFFNNLNEEYQKKYKIVEYETWYNEKNEKMLEKVAKYLEVPADYVPYIVIGKKVFTGQFANIKDDIKRELENQIEEEYTDIMMKI